MHKILSEDKASGVPVPMAPTSRSTTTPLHNHPHAHHRQPTTALLPLGLVHC